MANILQLGRNLALILPELLLFFVCGRNLAVFLPGWRCLVSQVGYIFSVGLHVADLGGRDIYLWGVNEDGSLFLAKSFCINTLSWIYKNRVLLQQLLSAVPLVQDIYVVSAHKQGKVLVGKLLRKPLQGVVRVQRWLQMELNVTGREACVPPGD